MFPHSENHFGSARVCRIIFTRPNAGEIKNSQEIPLMSFFLTPAPHFPILSLLAKLTSRSTSLCPVGLQLKKGNLSLSLSTGQCPGCVFFSQRANSNPSLVCSQFPTKLVFFTSLVIFLMERVVDFHYKQCSNPSFVCSQFPTNFKKINGEITCIFSKTNFARICVQSYIILYFY